MRFLAEAMSEEFGQKVIVENVYGQGGSIVIHMLLALKSDGYTIAASDLGPFGANIYDFTVRYQLKHIDPIAILHTSPLSLFTSRENIWFSVEDVFKPARESGRRIRVAHADSVSLNIFELISLYEEVEIFPIKQDNEAEVIRLVQEGYADIGIAGIEGFEKSLSGEIRALASTGSTRFASLPYALTLKEQGYEKIVYDSPFLLSVPTAVPEEIKNYLSETITKITSTEEYLSLLNDLELIPTIQGKNVAKEISRYSLTQVRYVNRAKEDGLPEEELEAYKTLKNPLRLESIDTLKSLEELEQEIINSLQ